MKLKIARLESILEQSIESLDVKFRYLREKEKLIEEMTNKIDYLHTVLSNIKVDSTYTEERISALEEEVKLLWAASRKNNFDIHNLEYKAQITDKKITAVTSEVQKMGDFVMEQWIQIRQLDQALKITEIRSMNSKKREAFARCTFLKFIKGISGHYLPKFRGLLEPHMSRKESTLHLYISQALHQLKSTTSAVKMSHHQLQGSVKQAMEMNELTAAFANQEVVFFVACALVIFPLWITWVLLFSQFS